MPQPLSLPFRTNLQHTAPVRRLAQCVGELGAMNDECELAGLVSNISERQYARVLSSVRAFAHCGREYRVDSRLVLEFVDRAVGALAPDAGTMERLRQLAIATFYGDDEGVRPNGEWRISTESPADYGDVSIYGSAGS